MWVCELTQSFSRGQSVSLTLVDRQSPGGDAVRVPLKGQSDVVPEGVPSAALVQGPHLLPHAAAACPWSGRFGFGDNLGWNDAAMVRSQPG